ncbi:act minimal PKS acyl carrier protein [Catenulispora sp. GAS73]|uniref:acyl carrier protein n=1 Tax=Catenulispora sp. GAS73 TaxID=3156269 RepID=UPI0035145130
MRELTLDGLRTMMRSCAGVDELVDLDSDIADLSFEDLGYDSLALLEIQSRIQQTCGVKVPDDALEHMLNPAGTIAWVNSLILAAAA